MPKRADISSILITCAAPLCMTVTACGNAATAGQANQLTPALAAEIEGICGLPSGSLTGKAAIPEDAMPKAACAVAEARKRNVMVGFISNPVDPDAQTH